LCIRKWSTYRHAGIALQHGAHREKFDAIQNSRWIFFVWVLDLSLEDKKEGALSSAFHSQPQNQITVTPLATPASTYPGTDW
jgi:hypothetical protein